MKKATIKLHRSSQDSNQSLSSVVVLNEKNEPVFASIGLERGWRNNEKSVSCIPAGTYKVVPEYSNRFKQVLWEIKNVPNRSECKFHASNYWNQLNGCVALGRRPKYLNADRYLDVTASRNTMADFHRALNGYDEAMLIITTEPNIH